MACSNCTNGCTEITPDQCVKYTGNDITALGISTGDTQLEVTTAITDYLITVLNGTGIILDITPADICALVRDELSDEDNITALDLFQALIAAACSLQTQVTAVVADVAVIEANYTVDCLTGVTATSGTHAILQAVITKLCTIDDDLTALALDLETNYVKLADLDALIQAYLDSIEVNDKAYAKMIPYSPIPYVGPLSNYPNTGDSFNISGAGANYWEDVYLCNGLNGTPDMRGRAQVGAISGVGGGALDPEVDPAVDPTFNPNYAVASVSSSTEAGANSRLLTEDNLPEHIHPITDVTHTHFSVRTGDFAGAALTALTPIAETDSAGTGDEEYELSGGTTPADIGLTSPAYTGITETDVNVTAADKVDVKQPVRAVYYIIYIPS